MQPLVELRVGPTVLQHTCFENVPIHPHWIYIQFRRQGGSIEMTAIDRRLTRSRFVNHAVTNGIFTDEEAHLVYTMGMAIDGAFS
jgi:hypothetical protein